jgi:hypothetical protein
MHDYEAIGLVGRADVALPERPDGLSGLVHVRLWDRQNEQLALKAGRTGLGGSTAFAAQPYPVAVSEKPDRGGSQVVPGTLVLERRVTEPDCHEIGSRCSCLLVFSARRTSS